MPTISGRRIRCASRSNGCAKNRRWTWCSAVPGCCAPRILANPHTVERADPLIAVQLGCAVFRRDVFDRVGLFDERLRFSEDHDWFLRAREQRIGMAVLDTVTLLHRRHMHNMTRGQAPQGYGLPAVLKASLDRRRARSGGSPLPLPRLADSCEAAAPRTQEHG